MGKAYHFFSLHSKGRGGDRPEEHSGGDFAERGEKGFLMLRNLFAGILMLRFLYIIYQ